MSSRPTPQRPTPPANAPAADAPPASFHFASPFARLVVYLDGAPAAVFVEGRFVTADAVLAERLAALDCCHAVAGDAA